MAWKVLKILAVFGLLLWLAGTGMLFVFQRSFLYFPDTARRSPAAAHFANATTMVLTSADHESIVAWYASARDDKPLFVFMHGNGGSLASVAPLFSALTSDGSGLLAVDYRGYGGSSGAPTEQGLILDGEAALAQAAALGYRAEKIVLVGQSLGTGVAVALAARHKVAALVLDAPYSATVDIAARTYWMVPVRLLMTDTFRSDLRIRDVHVPLLVMHGVDDTVIPIASGERLFALAHDPKLFLRVDGSHMVMMEPSMIARMRAWLKTVLPHPSPS